MMKKQKNILIILIVVIGIIIFGRYIFQLTLIIPDTTSQFIQYIEFPRESNCDIPLFDMFSSGKMVESKTAIISTPLSTFKIITNARSTIRYGSCKSPPLNAYNIQPTYVDGDGCQHWSYNWDQERIDTEDNCCWNIFASYTCTRAPSEPPTRTYEGSYDGPCPYSGYCAGGGERCAKCYCKIVDKGTLMGDYGGFEISNTVAGCDYSAQVYKDDVLIHELNYPEGEKISMAYSDSGAFKIGSLVQGDSGIEVQFAESQNYNPSCREGCVLRNWYRLYPPEKMVELELTTPKSSYMEGENVNLGIKIANNVDKLLIGKIILKYEVPTIIGTKESVQEQEVNLNAGENNYNYSIPTNYRTESLTVSPSVNIYLPTSDSSGVNVVNGFEEFPFVYLGQKQVLNPNIKVYPKLRIGNYAENPKEVQIIPKPIYYLKGSESCSVGYIESKDRTYCLSDSLKDLSCTITGCPEGYNPPYECASSGFCGQTIYVPLKCGSDEYCRNQTGTIATKCDIPTGFCFNEIVYTKILQCDSASDCLIPCDGKTPQCIDNKCNYFGKCEPLQCRLDIDCPQSPCQGLSYKCENNVCKSNGICFEKNIFEDIKEWIKSHLYLFISGIVFLFIILFILIKSKKEVKK